MEYNHQPNYQRYYYKRNVSMVNQKLCLRAVKLLEAHINLPEEVLLEVITCVLSFNKALIVSENARFSTRRLHIKLKLSHYSIRRTIKSQKKNTINGTEGSFRRID